MIVFGLKGLTSDLYLKTLQVLENCAQEQRGTLARSNLGQLCSVSQSDLCEAWMRRVLNEQSPPASIEHSENMLNSSCNMENYKAQCTTQTDIPSGSASK